MIRDPPPSGRRLARNDELTQRGRFFRRLRESGDPGRALEHRLVIKITPLRILALDLIELPGAPPPFDALLAENRLRHRLVKLGKNQPVHVVVPNETIDSVRSVLHDAASKVARDAA